jgi:hypothetical protein
MRKLVLTLTALAAFGIALPAVTSSASAETVVIKKNHGWHHGWRHHRDHVVVREGWRHRHHGARVVVHESSRHHHHGAAVVVR